ncbi:MAG: malate synthase G, partial [Pseudomonas putida]
MPNELQIAPTLQRFIEDEVLPGTGIEANAFWQGFSTLVHDLAPQNCALLAERQRLQTELDNWHRQHPGPIRDMAAYQHFLQGIGYLVDAPETVQISTRNVDREIAIQAGPQLVVPLSNARYALNAANARWGSLYDALYGTDAIAETAGAERGQGYNPVRGAKVIAYGRQFLDASAPLDGASHRDATAYAIDQGTLQVTLADGRQVVLQNRAQLRGYQGEPSTPTAILLQHHQLHFEIQIDPSSPIGRQ